MMSESDRNAPHTPEQTETCHCNSERQTYIGAGPDPLCQMCDGTGRCPVDEPDDPEQTGDALAACPFCGNSVSPLHVDPQAADERFSYCTKCVVSFCFGRASDRQIAETFNRRHLTASGVPEISPTEIRKWAQGIIHREGTEAQATGSTLALAHRIAGEDDDSGVPEEAREIVQQVIGYIDSKPARPGKRSEVAIGWVKRRLQDALATEPSGSGVPDVPEGEVRRLPEKWRSDIDPVEAFMSEVTANQRGIYMQCAQELEAALASAPAVERVPVEVAKRVIAARDAMIDGDDMEAWHQLYRIADPDCTQSKPWAELERIASAPTDGRE